MADNDRKSSFLDGIKEKAVSIFMPKQPKGSSMPGEVHDTAADQNQVLNEINAGGNAQPPKPSVQTDPRPGSDTPEPPGKNGSMSYEELIKKSQEISRESKARAHSAKLKP